MFMAVAAACLTVGMSAPSYALMFDDATDEERAEALRLFGEPTRTSPLCQLQIRRGWDGTGYMASKPTWDLHGPIWAATFADLRAEFLHWRP